MSLMYQIASPFRDRVPYTRQRIGFTLIEMIASLLLIGILAAVVVSRRVNLVAGPVSEADIMRSHLRFVQSLAIANNTSAWTVLVGGQSYQLRRNGQPASIILPGESSATHVLPAGVQVTGGTGTLAFNSLGAPASTVTITLSDGERTETVTVTGFTGLIP